MNKNLISIIVCTYNSNVKQLKSTLFSAIMQQNIETEIIITDDGSKSFEEDVINEFFEQYSYINYKILKHDTNQGTVKNIYDGLQHSKGEYVYLISPGDYFYNSTVVYELYNFCNCYHLDVCFGDAIYYSNSSDELKIYKTLFPKCKFQYLNGYFNPFLAQVAFFSGQQPVGASYFRKRDVFEQYLKLILGKVQYIEDFPTSASMLLDKKKIIAFNKPVVWYECDSGISNAHSSTISTVFKEDLSKAAKLIQTLYPSNAVVKAKYETIKLKRLKYLNVCVIAAILKVIGSLNYLFQKKITKYDGLIYILNQNEKYKNWDRQNDS